MNRIRKFTHEDPMRRIFPVNLGQLPRLPQDVDIIYTDGKADPIWPENSVGVQGMVVQAWVDTTRRRLEGIFAIDLRQCMSSSSRVALVTSFYGEPRLSRSMDFGQFRATVFETVAHEYFHLIQEWIVIVKLRDQQAFEKAYAAEHRRHEMRLMADDVRWAFRPDARRDAAYLRNRFENAARQAADAATHRLRAELDRGLWDSILPATEMQAMLKQGGSR